MLQAAILTIGDEILLGEIQDTNSNWLAERLVEAGINPSLRMSIGDEREHISEALAFATNRCELLIITGGLGPTRDDLTKICLAEFFNAPLEEHPEALLHLEEKLRRRGREMNDLVRTQALHPVGARLLKNQHGTAPGIWFQEKGQICIALPGVPYEMKQIFTDEVLPELQKLSGGFIQNHYFRTACIPETKLAQRLEEIENSMLAGIKLAYLPSDGEVKLRLTGRSNNLIELNEQMASIASKIRHTLGSDVYAEADITLAAVVARLLKENNFFLITDDASIKEDLQRKFREAAAFPEMASSPLPDRSGYRITFQPEAGSGSFSVQWEFFKSGLCLNSGQNSVLAFSQQDVFRNMLALRALDMLRRQLQDS